jgi:hypothetical protein
MLATQINGQNQIPIGTQVNYGGDPLANGLLYTIAFNPNEGATGITLFQREAYAAANGTAEMKASPYGVGLWETNGAYSYYSFPEGTFQHPNGDLSVFLVTNLDSLATFPTWCKITGTGLDCYHWGATSGVGSDGNVNFVLSLVATVNSGLVLTAGKWYAIAISYRRRIECEFWVKDLESGEVRYAKIATTSNPTAITGVGCLIGANSITGTNSSMNGYMPVQHIWSRLLTELEVYRLFNDFYAPFRKPLAQRFYISSGGTIYTDMGASIEDDRLSSSQSITFHGKGADIEIDNNSSTPKIVITAKGSAIEEDLNSGIGKMIVNAKGAMTEIEVSGGRYLLKIVAKGSSQEYDLLSGKGSITVRCQGATIETEQLSGIGSIMRVVLGLGTMLECDVMSGQATVHTAGMEGQAVEITDTVLRFNLQAGLTVFDMEGKVERVQ